MDMEIVKQTNSDNHTYLEIYYDHTINATVDIWKGDFESEENFKNGLLLVVENIKKNKSRKWLADLLEIEGSFDFARDFIAQTIIPQAIGFGLRYEALVVPKDIFAMLSVQETLMIVDILEIRIFGNLKSAVDWLNSK